jgi:hypothetical protein
LAPTVTAHAAVPVARSIVALTDSTLVQIEFNTNRASILQNSRSAAAPRMPVVHATCTAEVNSKTTAQLLDDAFGDYA